MEKITIDLEKLLDDFEFHEEQRTDLVSKQPELNDAHFPSKYSEYPRYHSSASSFDRSTFEPLNLSDANFSLSSRSSSVQSQSRYSPPIQSTTNTITCMLNDLRTMVSKGDSPVYSSDNKEFKPDLIKSNSSVCGGLTEFDRLERHLPDIASNDVEAKVDEKIFFNLIKDSFVNDVNCLNVQKAPVMDESRIIDSFPRSATDVPVEKFYKYNENVNKYDSTDVTESFEGNVNKMYVPLPSEVEVNEYRRRNRTTIDNEDVETIINEAGLALYSTEKTKPNFVNLNPEIKSINTSATVHELDSDNHEVESSIVETTSDVEHTVRGVNLRKSTPIQSVIDAANCNLSQQSVICVKSGYGMNENEVPIKTNLVSEPVTQYTETSLPYKHVAGGENDNMHNPESFLKNDYLCCKKGMDENTRNYAEGEINKGVSVNSLSDAESEPMSIVEIDCQFRDSKIREESTFLEDFDDEEQPSTSKDADKYDSQNKMNATSTTQFKIQRPDSLNLIQMTHNAEISSQSADSGSLLTIEERKLGKEPPVWIPDSETSVCMHCQTQFTLVRRRHHCRACGFVLCSKCCDLRATLEYLKFEEARVCHSCYSVIEKASCLEALSMKRPNPNNPMEYCSTIPPLLQVGPTQSAPPSVLVPVVGVLKREGRNKVNDTPKQVIFSDGIRPGGDLTELDSSPEPRLHSSKRHGRITKRVGTPPGNVVPHRQMLNPESRSFISSNRDLPPLLIKRQGQSIYLELEKPLTIESEPMNFAINCNLHVLVKRIILDCCVCRDVWCMTTEGLSFVGQDEIVFILEVLPDEKYPPKDVFWIINMLYQDASKGSTVTEMSFAPASMNQLFDSKEHAGFVFIRPTYQCIQKLLLPEPPFLIALLIHKWEEPWARLFPIRLILRLGAEFRYYPCPLVSVRNRPALFINIGNTIIGLLADFRKFSYSLPMVRGLMIHMEDRLTTILLPRNRYNQVIRAMNNSEENVLAFAGNISVVADSHLVCIQSVQNDLSYHTQAINIHNKPRQITGASFIVFNGSLKQCSWAGKSNIVEDGLMVQIPSESMTSLRSALRQMNDYSIGCGPQAEERVMLKWAPNDVNFNIGVKSHIDNRPLDGVPSIRVHNGTDYSGTSSRLIRWTEVFILQSDEDSGSKTGDTVNISKLSESIARATCVALVPLLDLLATANVTTLAVRAEIHPENVGYEAGSCGEKLRPLYMKRLDNELITVVHEAAVSIRDISCPIVLELIFKIMEQG